MHEHNVKGFFSLMRIRNNKTKCINDGVSKSFGFSDEYICEQNKCKCVHIFLNFIPNLLWTLNVRMRRKSFYRHNHLQYIRHSCEIVNKRLVFHLTQVFEGCCQPKSFSRINPRSVVFNRTFWDYLNGMFLFPSNSIIHPSMRCNHVITKEECHYLK